MTLKNFLFITIGLAVVTILIALSLFSGVNLASASAPSGLPATVATSSAQIVSSTVATIVATSTNCSARIITTTNKPIMLTFSDYSGQSPSATFGHLQSASTTVAYDSGIYGCGRVKAYGFDTSSNITTTETK